MHGSLAQSNPNLVGGAAGSDGDSLLDPDAIAETYWQTHRQPRSAWSQEVELRPYKEPF